MFLYNPNSGKGKVAKKIDYVRKKLEKKYDVVDIVETTSGADLEAKAREGALNYDVILFSGGDGTNVKATVASPFSFCLRSSSKSF